MKVLSNLRVVEVVGLGPGPFCAMHLADLGAEVISIFRPPSEGLLSSEKVSILDRGKRSLILDLKKPEDKAILLQLIEDADVLIEGMRPGVMERLGAGPDICHNINPRLVYGRMTGWGQSGPLSTVAGHDNNYIALSGALWYASPLGSPPITPFAVLGDIGGGALYLAVGILAGVFQARLSGKGCVVDAAIVDGSAHMLNLMLQARSAGIVADKRGESIHDSSPFYATYQCADNEYITVGAIEPQFYSLLLKALSIENEPLFQSPQWDRNEWPARCEYLTQLFKEKTCKEWQALLEGSDCCVAIVQSPLTASKHPHNQARGIYFEADGQLQAAPAPRFNGEVYTPTVGEDTGASTEEILATLKNKGSSAVWRAR